MIKMLHFINLATINNLRVFARRMISLTLVFLVLCTGSIGSVLAAPPDRPLQAKVYKFVLTAERKGNPKAPVCLDDTVTFLVGARRIGYEKGQTKPKNSLKVAGFPVTATGNDSLKLTSASPAQLTWDLSNGVKVEFTFKAQKIGTAEVYFDAMAPVEYVPDEMIAKLSPEALKNALYMKTSATVKVIDCPIKVSGIDRYEINSGGGYLIDMVAVLDDTTLTSADPEGKVYTGEAIKQIVTRQFAPGCKIIIGVGTRPVKIKVERLETELKITLTDGEMTIEDFTSCPGGEVGLPIVWPDTGPITIELPLKGGHHQYFTSDIGFMVNLKTIVTRVKPK